MYYYYVSFDLVKDEDVDVDVDDGYMDMQRTDVDFIGDR